MAADFPKPDGFDLLVCHPVETDPDRRPCGVYWNQDGNVAEYVYPGVEPDPAVLNPLQSRLHPWGKILTVDFTDAAPGTCGQPVC